MTSLGEMYPLFTVHSFKPMRSDGCYYAQIEIVGLDAKGPDIVFCATGFKTSIDAVAWQESMKTLLSHKVGIRVITFDGKREPGSRQDSSFDIKNIEDPRTQALLLELQDQQLQVDRVTAAFLVLMRDTD